MNTTNWKELIQKYKAYLLILVIVLVAVVTLARSCGSNSEEEQTDITETTETDTTEEAEEEEAVNELKENTHASIDRLITKFMDCLMDGDLDTMEEITDYLSEEDRQNITARALAYESYSDLQCFTKDGPEEDSYIVYVTCDITILNVDTPAPFYICVYVSPRDDDGSRYIRYNDVEEDEELQAYVMELEQDPEVQALIDNVNTRYQEALENDKTLYDFIQNATGKAQESDTEEAASEEETASEETESEEAEAEETASEETESEETGSEAEEAAETTVQNRETRVTESVNIRAEASTDSDRIALAYQGDSITQIESRDDGWSKVEYKGQTGYVKTEFLE